MASGMAASPGGGPPMPVTAVPTILMVSGEYPPMRGGVGDYTSLLSRHLEGQGARVRVLAGVRSGTGGQQGPPAVPEASWTVHRWDYSAWRQVAAAAAGGGATIVHIQYQAAAYGMHPAVNLLPGYLRVRLPRLRVVTTFHDLRVPYLFPKAWVLRRAAVRAMDRFSHASVLTNQADLLGLGGPTPPAFGNRPGRWLIPLASNVDCAPPPSFNRAEWRHRLGAGDDVPLLCYFGLMSEGKGMETLLESLGLLVARGLGPRLVIIGGEVGDADPGNRGCLERTERLIAALGLQDRVVRTGFLPPEEVSASLLASDLCLLPFRDGASLRSGSLLAALAHGLPVVTTLPCQPEPLLEDSENVVMVERENPSSLAAAVESLWRDPGARRKLVSGAGRLSRRFRWPSIAAQHLDMYDVLSKSDRRSGKS